MDIVQILNIVQIVIAVSMTLIILMQRGESGLGTVFGGSVNESFRTRRGFEAFLFNATIFLGVALVTNTLALTLVTNI